MISTSVSVTASATELFLGGGTVNDPFSGLIRVPEGGTTIYVGGSAVTTATGVPLYAGESLPLDEVSEKLYGITATGTQVVNVLKEEG